MTIKEQGSAVSSISASASQIVPLGNVGATRTLTLAAGARETWAIGTLTVNAALTIVGLTKGQTVRLFVTQDLTGSRTLTITASGIVATPAIQTAPGSVTTVVLYYDGVQLYNRADSLTNTTPSISLTIGTSAGTASLQLANKPFLLKGVTVWGVTDPIVTSAFGDAQYAARGSIVPQISSWGFNCIRFRLYASYYNGLSTAGQATYVAQIKAWHDLTVAAGLYFMPCCWDALDGPYGGAAYATNYTGTQALQTACFNAFGGDSFTIWEPVNEPNSISWAQWQTAMQSQISFFRTTLGYRGVLLLDPISYANSGTGGGGYDNTTYTALETYDAGLLGGQHQLMFSKHDYANEYGGTWSDSSWQAGVGGTQTSHVICESEIGNYNGSAGTVNYTWDQAAISDLRTKQSTMANYAGRCDFLWGPWYDANALTTSDNVTPTQWGQIVKTSITGNASLTTLTVPSATDWTFAAGVTVSAGVVTVPLTTTYTSSFNTNADYVASGAYFSCQLALASPGNGTKQVDVALSDDTQQNKLGFDWTGSTLYAYRTVGGTRTGGSSVAVAGSVYVKVAEQNSTVTWSYSADGVTWTVLQTMADPFAASVLTAMKIIAFGAYYGTETASNATVSNFAAGVATGAPTTTYGGYTATNQPPASWVPYATS